MSTSDNATPSNPETASTAQTDTSADPVTPSAGTSPAAQQAESTGVESTGSQPTSSPPATTSPVAPVAIGSQRDAAEVSPSKPKAVTAAESNPVDLRNENDPQPEVVVVPEVVRSQAGLGDDIDAEIEAALGAISMDDVVDNAEATDVELELNSRLQAVVTKIHKDNVFFKLAGQYEGVAALHTFKKEPAEGETLDVIVRGVNKEDGLYELSVPGATLNVSDWDDLEEGAVIEAKVTAVNSGGLEAAIGSLRGFIPASQASRYRVEDLSVFIDQKLPCVIVECKPSKRKLVLSHRAVLEREQEEKRKILMEELEVGQIREGVVTKLMDFGAFVDLGGAEGLIHISKISWTRVRHPREVMQEGERVKVKVDKIDDAGKIGLSHRDTLEHPWHSQSNQFNEDDIVEGTVTKVMDFGAFVEIAPGIEGLVHISELAHHRVSKVSTVVNEGDKIEVKILSVDKDSQKISLSKKACLSAPASKGGDKKDQQPEDLPARELVVKSSGEPLQGGTNRPSGGESVGLKW